MNIEQKLWLSLIYHCDITILENSGDSLVISDECISNIRCAKDTVFCRVPGFRILNGKIVIVCE